MPKNNLVIDARWITPTPSGIGVYTRELIRRLPRLEPSWKWHLIFKDKALADKVIEDCAFDPQLNVECHIVPYGIFSPKSQLLLPKLLRKLNCTLFHSPSFCIPYLAFGTIGTFFGISPLKDKGCGRSVVTIHDVIPLILSEYAPRSKTKRLLPVYREYMRAAARSSAAIITGSETSKRDISSVLNLSQELRSSIRTIYDGVSDRFTPIPKEKRNESETRIILYVGRLDPYKNVPMLVDAFAQLKRKTKEKLHLLIIGPEDRRYPEARNHANARGISEHVTFFHGATDKDLLDAYRSASLLVNPSRYEGFGLPQLEAMKCGVPVICADGGSQREITAGAAKVVPVGDEPALVAAMEEVLFNDKTRVAMIERGLARATDFSWDKTAAETMRLYKEVLALPIIEDRISTPSVT